MPAPHRAPAAPWAGKASPRHQPPVPGWCSLLPRTSGQWLILCLPPIKSPMGGCCSHTFGLLCVVQGGSCRSCIPPALSCPAKRHQRGFPVVTLGPGCCREQNKATQWGCVLGSLIFSLPQGPSPGVEEALLKGNTRQAASVPGTKGHSDPGFAVAHTAQKTSLPGGKRHQGMCWLPGPLARARSLRLPAPGQIWLLVRRG